MEKIVGKKLELLQEYDRGERRGKLLKVSIRRQF
jgi:hypothetical protein